MQGKPDEFGCDLPSSACFRNHNPQGQGAARDEEKLRPWGHWVPSWRLARVRQGCQLLTGLETGIHSIPGAGINVPWLGTNGAVVHRERILRCSVKYPALLQLYQKAHQINKIKSLGRTG